MNIRPETPADYARIANLQVHAFSGQIAEALIVMLMRNRQEFDPDLSLVAEVDHRIVGHILFSPFTMSLMGQQIKAVNLGPLGIESLYQGKGIGSALVQEGHRVAREKGYSLSFVLGYDTYYPRFGYKPEVYGSSFVTLTRDHLNPPPYKLSTHSPGEVDCPALFGLALGEEYHVDFSLMPGESPLDWISPNPNIRSTVYVREDTVVGYTRIHKDEPDRPRMFLAFDKAAAHAMAALLMGDQPSVTLPLHPFSKSAGAFSIKPNAVGWKSGMACGLLPGLFDDFYARFQAGKRPPGRVLWPVSYDMI